ncbi:FeoB-associated Cys-rich membrane protein [Ancylomarina euxinus]|uniref:FeoB-associated Cys-rich membrane protein n=1 Tax=Ancylomarina euxinus TaxID=2283627 RepID=A0A425Y1H6_9BACT|nr:FeoB-associated Cys-rich membrane protein [Ancylomarina euxinus]MCZ4695155.1 FeoB-associated Cys-rich membrane protein [Ancylomarina euxinus]MUP14911.1 FeoB-associated Cys-rich membrane protein [Ancylomarina euxinus]RRG21805.1 FeoB-associated Cys-rich membrane protein [Ancylomarina euxinus]
MDFQLFTTYLIILVAVTYSLYHFYKVIKPRKKTSLCGGCASCDIKKELMKNKIKFDGLKMDDR